MSISIQTLYKHGFNMKSHFDWEFELVLNPNPHQKPRCTIAGCTIFDCKLYHLDEVQKFAKPANKGTNPIGTLGPYEVTFVRKRIAAEDHFCMMQQVDLP